MPTPENQEIILRLDELITATKNGTIEWRAANPTTYLWEKVDSLGNGARLTLQRVMQNVHQAIPGRGVGVTVQQTFILQVFEMGARTQTQRLTISGATDAEINNKLSQLFQIASLGVSQRGLDFLKKVISGTGTTSQ